MRVLLISSSFDPHADVLAGRLEELGAETGRFNIDLLPKNVWSRLSISGDGTSIVLPDGTTEADSVYYRRLAMIRGHGLWPHIPEDTRQFVVAEAEAALFGICHALDDRPWVNYYAGLETHVNKPAGLMMARTTGWSIPDTLVSNDPEAIRAFYDKHGGKIIFKATSANAVRLTTTQSALLYTNRVKPEHFQRDDLIIAVPGIYQAEVPRRDELRITVIDDTVFGARVIPGQPENVDWRRGLGKGTTFEPCDISDSTAEKLVAFMKVAGIRYGAFDVIVTPTGEEVFLEVNPQGAYLWLERELGLPISMAIARALVRGF